jgi:hypothetical protein
MLQFNLEKPGELKAQGQDAGDTHRGVLVTAEHLIHVSFGDHAPRSSAPVAGQHHALIAHQCHDRRGMR